MFSPSFLPKFLLCLCLLLLTREGARAYGGQVDPTFGPAVPRGGSVQALGIQNDQKMVVAGTFTSIGTTPAVRVARLNADGTVDTSFDAGTGPDNEVRFVALQADGKVLLAGRFTTVGGAARTTLARLNANGSLDTSFNAGSAAGGYEIGGILIQTDGKILVYGQFHGFAGDGNRRSIVRLNSDGTIDSSFAQNITGSSGVKSAGLAADGKIYIAGGFTTLSGVARKYLARLNQDGTLDNSFDPGAGPTQESTLLLPTTDGKLLVRGPYLGTGPDARRRLFYKLGTDGTLDTSFNADPVPVNSSASISRANDGRFLIWGGFMDETGAVRRKIGILQPNGAIDPLFDPGDLPENVVAAGMQSDGKVIVGTYESSVLRLLAPDTSPPIGPAPVLTALPDGNGFRLTWSEALLQEGYKVERSPDGVGNWTVAGATASGGARRLYSGGIAPGNTVHYRVRAVNRHGEGVVSAPLAAVTRGAVWPGQVDLSLDPLAGGISGETAVCLTMPDGKLLVAGTYRQHPADIYRTVLARLNPDGTLDKLYDASYSYTDSFYSMVIQPDGKVIVGGRFQVNNGTSSRSIARFNLDGSEDTTFSASVYNTYGGLVMAMALQPDGKILIGGYFTRVNQTNAGCVARLNTDGSVDPGFNAGTGANDTVRTLALAPDGRVVIGGDFNLLNGASCGRVARLLPNGSFDSSFAINTGADRTVHALEIQPDGKVIIAGEFVNYQGLASPQLIRLSPDGSRDGTYAVPSFSNYSTRVRALYLQPDGRCVIGGSFSSIGGVARNSAARLMQDGTLDTSFDMVDQVTINSLQPTTGGKVIAVGDVTLRDGSIQSGPIRISLAGNAPPPPPPTGLTVVGKNSAEMTVSWQASPGATNYLLERSSNVSSSWVFVGQTPTNQPLFTDTGLLPGTLYYYRIRSSNASGSSARTEAVSGYTMTFPTAPGNLQVRGYGGYQAILNWTWGTASAYVIERSADGGVTWTILATVDLYSPSYRDSSLAGNTTYQYRVRSVNDGGDSAVTSALPVSTGVSGVISAGSLDPLFTTGAGFQKNPESYYVMEASHIFPLANGKTIVCGNFGGYDGVSRLNILRLNADGSPDSGFDAGAWKSYVISSAAIQPDGKILVGGNFVGENGNVYQGLVRLNENGSKDSSFDASAAVSAAQYTAFYYGIQSLLVQPDGKILMGGSSILRLNADGSKDTGFTSQFTGAGTPWIHSMACLSDGDILVSGIFSNVNGVARIDLARLNGNGTLDMAFNAGFSYSSGSGFSYGNTIAVQNDGKILRADNRGGAGTGLTRFLPTGAIDTGFTPPVINYNSSVYGIAIQGDGKIVVTGSFETIAGSMRRGVARLNAYGTLDSAFDTGMGVASLGRGLAIQPDGKILISGSFSEVDGQPRSCIARLHGNPATWSAMEAWKISQGISPVEQWNADRDSDGMNDLIEYAMGANPLKADSYLLPTAVATPEQLSLSYKKLRPDLSYVVEVSSDLRNWTTQGVNQGASQGSVTASVLRSGFSRQFLRVRVKNP